MAKAPGSTNTGEGPGPGVEGPALLVVDEDHAADLPRVAGVRPEAAGHGPRVSVPVCEGAGWLAEDYMALPFRALMPGIPSALGAWLTPTSNLRLFRVILKRQPLQNPDASTSRPEAQRRL